MKYLVDVNGERVEVVLDADGVTVDGRRELAHLAECIRTGAQTQLTARDGLHVLAVEKAILESITTGMPGVRTLVMGTLIVMPVTGLANAVPLIVAVTLR